MKRVRLGFSALLVHTALTAAAPPQAAAETGTVFCLGREVTILGTPGYDEIAGTYGPDVIHGRAEGDLITSFPGDLLPDSPPSDGDDVVCGGAGYDSVITRRGNDLVSGGGDDDEVNTWSGDDVVFGGRGNDVLEGGEGNDRLSGGEGNDDLLDGSCLTNCGDDVMRGGPGDDNICACGEDGVKRAFGGQGDDSISLVSDLGTVDGNVDYANGGDGFDTCFVDPLDTYRGCEVVTVSSPPPTTPS